MSKVVGLIPKKKKQEPKMTKAEVMEKLNAEGIEFDEKAKLEELVELLKTANKED